MAPASVVLEEGPDGLRAREFSHTADQEHWESLWADAAQTYGPAEQGHLPHQLRATFARVVPPPARVLEAGCGLGHFTVAAAALGYRAVGIDWAGRTLEQVKQRFPAIPFDRGDVRALPYRTGSFDAVYSPGVCEHFEDGPDPILGETLRVLRPGGVAVVSTPCLNPLRRRLWDGRTGSATQAGPFYQFLFTPDGMARTLERVGFVDVEAHPYGVWATFAEEWPVLGRVKVGRAAGILDLVPGLRRLGSTCIWTARKPRSTPQ